jgi:hypothetical protein
LARIRLHLVTLRSADGSPFFGKLRTVAFCAALGALLVPLLVGYFVMVATRESGAARGLPVMGWKGMLVIFLLTSTVILVGGIFGFWAGAAAAVVFGIGVGALFGIWLESRVWATDATPRRE